MTKFTQKSFSVGGPLKVSDAEWDAIFGYAADERPLVVQEHCDKCCQNCGRVLGRLEVGLCATCLHTM